MSLALFLWFFALTPCRNAGKRIARENWSATLHDQFHDLPLSLSLPLLPFLEVSTEEFRSRMKRVFPGEEFSTPLSRSSRIVDTVMNVVSHGLRKSRCTRGFGGFVIGISGGKMFASLRRVVRGG